MARAAAILLALLAAACAAAPPPAPAPAPAPPPVADEHPAVVAAPREPVAAAPLPPQAGAPAAPGGGPAPGLFDTRTIPPPGPPAQAAAPAARAPARLAPARAAELVGAWRVIALAAEDGRADASRAAPVFLAVGADSTIAELVVDAGEPPRDAAQLAARLPPPASRERWSLNGELVVVARGGGFAPEAWVVERVAAGGALGDARAEAGDLVRTLVGRNGRPGARQLLRRLPGG